MKPACYHKSLFLMVFLYCFSLSGCKVEKEIKAPDYRGMELVQPADYLDLVHSTPWMRSLIPDWGKAEEYLVNNTSIIKAPVGGTQTCIYLCKVNGQVTAFYYKEGQIQSGNGLVTRKIESINVADLTIHTVEWVENKKTTDRLLHLKIPEKSDTVMADGTEPIANTRDDVFFRQFFSWVTVGVWSGDCLETVGEEANRSYDTGRDPANQGFKRVSDTATGILSYNPAYLPPARLHQFLMTIMAGTPDEGINPETFLNPLPYHPSGAVSYSNGKFYFSKPVPEPCAIHIH